MENITPQILAMYIGQQVKTPSGIGELHEINNDGGCTVVFSRPGSGYDGHFFEDDVKPILRPLSDMTIEEKNDPVWTKTVDFRIVDAPTLIRYCAPQFAYLLSRGFDLFNLIPAGLAVDKTKM